MKKVWTFFLDTMYDLFGVLFLFLIIAVVGLILYWRLSLLFAL